MKIHEYQAAALFAAYGVRVPEGQMAKTAAEAEAAARALGEGPFVIKAQVHSGGRGKAGGVKFANTPGEAAEKAKEILGMDAGDEDRPARRGGWCRRCSSAGRWRSRANTIFPSRWTARGSAWC